MFPAIERRSGRLEVDLGEPVASSRRRAARRTSTETVNPLRLGSGPRRGCSRRRLPPCDRRRSCRWNGLALLRLLLRWFGRLRAFPADLVAAVWAGSAAVEHRAFCAPFPPRYRGGDWDFVDRLSPGAVAGARFDYVSSGLRPGEQVRQPSAAATSDFFLPSTEPGQVKSSFSDRARSVQAKCIGGAHS